MFGLNRQKKVKAWMKTFMETVDATVEFPKKKWYDCEITYKGRLYLCRFYRIPKNCQITVNNRYIWQIINGRPGIVTVPRVEKLIDGKDPRPHVKVAVIVNNVGPIRRWINECEMEFVDPYTDIYGAKMIDLDKFPAQIEALR